MSEHDGDAPAGGDKRGWSALFNLLMLVVGGLALTWMLRTTSWHELRNVLTGVGAWAAVILGLELGGLLCDAAALHAFMRPEARMVSYLRVLGAQSSQLGVQLRSCLLGAVSTSRLSFHLTSQPGYLRL